VEATRILTENRNDWIAIAEGLLEYETLSGEEIRQLLAGNKPTRDSGDDTPPSRGSAVPRAGATRGKPKGGEEPDAPMEPQPQG
jgi:cell division protease FtsH